MSVTFVAVVVFVVMAVIIFADCVAIVIVVYHIFNDLNAGA